MALSQVGEGAVLITQRYTGSIPVGPTNSLKIKSLKRKIEEMDKTIIPTGMKLVENEKKVTAISRAVERCDGFCPCLHIEVIINKEDLRCPCLQSRVENICVCGLYEKE